MKTAKQMIAGIINQQIKSSFPFISKKPTGVNIKTHIDKKASE
jgi:hypothetical protein